MKKITDDLIEYIGILSKLELSEYEREQAKEDITDMMNFFENINEVDTDGVMPMYNLYSNMPPLRDDVVTNGSDSENMLSNAPVKSRGAFVVPKTISDEG